MRFPPLSRDRSTFPGGGLPYKNNGGGGCSSYILRVNSVVLALRMFSLSRSTAEAFTVPFRVLYGGPEGTSFPYKNVTISLTLCHPSLKTIVVFCVNLTVLYRNERLFLKKLRSFPVLSSASSIKTIT